MAVLVDVEYDSAAGYRAEVEDLKNKLEAWFGGTVDFTAVAGRPNAFEVKVDGAVVHSKLERGDFPEPEYIKGIVHDRLTSAHASRIDPMPPTVPTTHVGLDMKDLMDTRGAVPGRDYSGQAAEDVYRTMGPRRIFGRPFWSRWPMFWYPYTIDYNYTRCISVLVCALSILVAIFHDKTWAHYLCALILVDYIIRILFGGRATLLGGLTWWIAYYLPIRPYPGAPKQFALFLYILFPTAATILFWHGNAGHGRRIAAAVVMAVFAAIALLEAIGFCIGCMIYRMVQRVLRFNDPSISSDLMMDEYLAEETYWRTRQQDINHELNIRHAPQDENDRRIPVAYRTKNYDAKKDYFNPVKYIHPSYLWWPVAMAGIALCWKYAEDDYHVSRKIWNALIIAAAVIFVLILSIMIVQFAEYPRRTIKHWDSHYAYALVGLPLAIALFAHTFYDEWDSRTFSKVLFWIAGAMLGIMTVALVGRWIRRPVYRSWLGPDWVMLPVANFAVAALGPLVDADYVEVSFFWFATGLILWIILFTSSFSRVASGGPIYHYHRPWLWMWLAAPALAMVAYCRLGLFVVFDFFALILFYFALFMFFVLFFMYPLGYFNRRRFHVNYWYYIFPLQAFCLACITYHIMHPTGWTDFLAKASLAVASYATAMAFAHTLSRLLTRHLFNPDPDWGPGMAVPLIHGGLRGALRRMEKLALRIDRPEALKELAALRVQYDIALDIESKFEDSTLFPQLDEHFPGMSAAIVRQHDELVMKSSTFSALLLAFAPSAKNSVLARAGLPLDSNNANAVGANPTQSDLKTIRDMLQQTAEFERAHYEYEESHLYSVLRKYSSFKRDKDNCRHLWFSATANQWRVALPFIISNMELHANRVEFLEYLAMAIPDHMHLVGQILYEGLDRLTWERLVVDCPEMIPRNVDYHSRRW